MVKISFLGDISFNDEYINLYKEGIKPFNNISKILSDSDYVVGNLECLAKGESGENLLKSTRVKTTLETLNYLKDININLVTLAHNHVYDNLLDGFNKTTKFLEQNNIEYLGAGTTKSNAVKILIKNIKDIKFCFLNYVREDTNPNLPENSGVYLNWFKKETIINAIKKNRNYVDYIILLLHWGGRCEGGSYPDFEQHKTAKELINAGADLIVGHHAHTLQPYDVYNNKYVFYCLGNFCFADVYTNGRIVKEIDQKKGVESIILNTKFNNNSYSIDMVPFNNKNLTIQYDSQVLKRYAKKLMFFKIIKSFKPIWYFYYLKLKYYNPVIFYFFGNNKSFIKQLKLLHFKKVLNFLKK